MLTGTLPFILGGTIAGQLIGKLRDNGITNAFLKSVDHELCPNSSALVIYGHSNPGRKDEPVTRMAPFNPKVLESGLPPELESALNQSLLAGRRLRRYRRRLI